MVNKSKILIFITVFFVLSLAFSGCSSNSKEEDVADLDFDKIFAEMSEEEDEKFTAICNQDEIPVLNAQECFFWNLRECEFDWWNITDDESDEEIQTIPRENLDKCWPIFVRDSIVENL
jgi:hypothetical protein